MKNCERFSSSGLAGSFVDELKLKGIIARFVFAPRRFNDGQPFLVVWDDASSQDGENSEEEPPSCMSMAA